MTAQLLLAQREVPSATSLSHTEYLRLLERRLGPTRPSGATCIDGWAGCGGLSLGFEAAGFAVTGYELDPHAVATYRANLEGICHQHTITPDTLWPDADVFIGGPPCQPFSVTGNQLGTSDPRNGFPSFVAAVDRIKPKAWLFENVPGLAGRRATPYFEHVLRRLRRRGYRVTTAILNAADHGVPQNRRRLVAIGTLEPFRLPPPPMLHTTTGAALGQLAHRRLDDRLLTPSQVSYIARYEKKSQCLVPRDLHLDRPARTLTCRNLAGATGDMQRLRRADGTRRRLTVAEAARLQSFPLGFEFKGPESSRFRQIGNAVPPLVARHLADALLEQAI